MFFPEGGHLVEGATQNVGLYICNGTNQPVQTRFWILKNATDTIASGKTTLSGLATFGFMPQSGVNYTLQTSKSKQSFLLPSLSPTPTIQAIIHKIGWFAIYCQHHKQVGKVTIYIFTTPVSDKKK